MGTIGGIGEMLGFEAKGAVFCEGAADSAHGFVEEIAAVKLDAGLGGEDFHGSAGGWIAQDGGGGKFSLGSQDVIVIISAGGLGDALADCVRRGEIEGGALHGGEFAGGDECFIDDRVSIGVDRQFVI